MSDKARVAEKWRGLAATYGIRLHKTPSVKRLRAAIAECQCRVWEARGGFVLGAQEFFDVVDENRWAGHYPLSEDEREWVARQRPTKKFVRSLDAFEASGRGV